MNTYIFASSSALYLIIRLMKASFDLPDVFEYHFTDLIVIPWIVSATSILMSLLKKAPEFSVSFSQLVFAIVYTSIVFEWILPSISETYTQDIVDVLAYILGGALYFIIQKKTPSKKRGFIVTEQ